MKIFTGSNYYPEHLGGIEFVAKNLVQKWREKHQVIWMACDVIERPHACVEGDLPIQASNFTENLLGFPYPIPVPWALRKIYREIRDCDLVHLHDCLYLANLAAFYMAIKCRKPVVITQHIELVIYAETYKNLLQRLAYRTAGKWILENADQIIFVSDRVRLFFESWIKFRNTPKIISNGIDRKLFYPPINNRERERYREKLGVENGAPALLFIGRLTQKKGLNHIYDIARACPNWNWWIIGNGEINPSEWQLNNVKVIPQLHQNKLRQFYLSADLLILPSAGEGFPLVAQEALACGLPIAISEETASNITDAPIIKLNTNDLGAMINKIDEFLSCDKSQVARRSAESAAYASRWNWDEVSEQYLYIFSSLVAPKT